MLLVGALAVALMIAVVVILETSSKTPSATTADGRTVTIEQVTFGTHHRFIHGKWWVRLLRPIRGKSWAAQRGCYETRFTNDRPALMVWTRWQTIDKSQPFATEATVVDQSGTESEVNSYRWYDGPLAHGNPPGAAAWRVGWVFNSYPRRSKTLRLRFHDRDKRHMLTQVVEVAFSNPKRKRRFSEWPRRELPLVITSNDVQFALTSVHETSNALWRLNFVVRTNGVIDPSWLVGGVTASSVSGNLFVTRSNLAAASATNIAFQLRGALWPEEPTWRFGVEFVRTADFQPAELWKLPNLAIPARNMPLQFTTNLSTLAGHPLGFKLESIPRAPPSPYRPRGIRRNANLYVHFEAPDRHLLLVEAKDDQGRRIESEVFPGAPRLHYFFGLEIPPGAQSVDLTFAIRPPTIVKFDAGGSSFTRLRGK
jgi:hypothetical protein